jgi:hypothetical protein
MTEIDKTDKNLLLINYPSGGYGVYLTRLINKFVTNVVQTNDDFLFDDLGTSHSLPLVVGHIHYGVNRMLHAADSTHWANIKKQKYILIPYCPGIPDDTTDNLKNNFPNAKIIKLCYQDNTWPLVFQNCIVKAVQGTSEANVEFDVEKFGVLDDWARRENFSLLFEHHHYRIMWKEHVHDNWLNIDISELITDPQNCLEKVANFIGGSMINLRELPFRHQQFLNANPNTVQHLEILNIVKNLNIDRDLTHINQLYHQAVLNFYVQLEFNFVIPANDYANWFTNTKEIVTMLKDHGVYIDTN